MKELELKISRLTSLHAQLEISKDNLRATMQGAKQRIAEEFSQLESIIRKKKEMIENDIEMQIKEGVETIEQKQSEIYTSNETMQSAYDYIKEKMISLNKVI